MSHAATSRERGIRLDDCDEEEEDRGQDGSGALLKRMFEHRTVLLCGPVNDKMARSAMTQLLLMDAEESERPIRVYINSPGGAVDAGFAILDTMRAVKSQVHSICAGLAASAATVILLGADEGHRYSLPHTRYLLHQPSTGVQGQASDVLIGAKEILKIRQEINEILAAGTGQSVERIAEDTMRDFWMSAGEAKDYGLIDSVVGSIADLPG